MMRTWWLRLLNRAAKVYLLLLGVVIVVGFGILIAKMTAVAGPVVPLLLGGGLGFIVSVIVVTEHIGEDPRE